MSTGACLVAQANPIYPNNLQIDCAWRQSNLAFALRVLKSTRKHTAYDARWGGVARTSGYLYRVPLDIKCRYICTLMTHPICRCIMRCSAYSSVCALLRCTVLCCAVLCWAVLRIADFAFRMSLYPYSSRLSSRPFPPVVLVVAVSTSASPIDLDSVSGSGSGSGRAVGMCTLALQRQHAPWIS